MRQVLCEWDTIECQLSLLFIIPTRTTRRMFTNVPRTHTIHTKSLFHTHTHTHTHTDTHEHSFRHHNTSTHKLSHMHIHAQTCTLPCPSSLTSTHVNMHTHTHTRKHPGTHTHTDTPWHTHTHTHTPRHSPTQADKSLYHFPLFPHSDILLRRSWAAIASLKTFLQVSKNYNNKNFFLFLFHPPFFLFWSETHSTKYNSLKTVNFL